MSSASEEIPSWSLIASELRPTSGSSANPYAVVFRDEEKGKKMWSKYLEREDSKIVGE